MTDTIEQKALALVNEVLAEGNEGRNEQHIRGYSAAFEALCRAIEQHEAFRQEVSDAVEKLLVWPSIRSQGIIVDSVARFIIAKPDPLVEALWEAGFAHNKDTAANLRAAIEKRGGKIVWGEG